MTLVETLPFRTVDSSTDRIPRILFVDDEPNMAGVMQRNLHPYRLELQVAYHGMQGILDALATRPDVIITDMQMPFATGDELIECLAANSATSGTPIIVVTGLLDVRLTARLKRLGVVEVLTKPVDFADLRDTLAKFIPLVERAGPGLAVSSSLPGRLKGAHS
jgi:two-component system chemotaxis response regulator CheY